MSKRDVLKRAQDERNRVPLGDWIGYVRANERVRDAYNALAQS